MQKKIRKLYAIFIILLTLVAYNKFGNMIVAVVSLVFLIFLPYIPSFIIKKIKKSIYLHSPLSKVDKMSGEEFELYLKAHFENLGYRVKHIGQTGDYGADLILTSNKHEKIVVQAKRYNNSVGVTAVQEVISAKTYYSCDSAMVVTNSVFTTNAIKMAKQCEVELWNRDTCRKKFKI